MFLIMHPLKIFEHEPQYIPIHKLHVWISLLIYYASYNFFLIEEIKNYFLKCIFIYYKI